MPLSKSKLVVVGSGGRLGAALMRAYSALAQVTGFNHSELNLASSESIEQTLGDLDFDVLINCAALTNVDYCETHVDEAFAVNARAVGHIARICSEKQARCIHISTDYVFDGNKREAYCEEDEALPISVYGASKRQGEIELLTVSEKHLAVRVAWVFGPDRPSFVDQILKRAQETAVLQAIGDKWSCPTFTLDAVALLRPFLCDLAVGGIVHLTQAGGCTWQEYGQYALDAAAAAGMPLKGRRVAYQSMADLAAFVAKRPVHTVLSTRRLEALTGCVPRPWQEAVSDYIRQYYAPHR